MRTAIACALAVLAASACGRRDTPPPAPGALRGTPVLLSGSGIRYTRAYTHVPMTLPAHASILNLGMILADSPQPSDATPFPERFVREAPRDRYARDIRRVQATLARIQR